MHGWVTVALVAGAQLAGAIVLIRRGVRRWWNYLAIAVLAAGLIALLGAVTGDVSALLPAWAFSESAEGKDQIVVLSALSTVLLPLVIASAIVWLANRMVRTRGSAP